MSVETLKPGGLCFGNVGGIVKWSENTEYRTGEHYKSRRTANISQGECHL